MKSLVCLFGLAVLLTACSSAGGELTVEGRVVPVVACSSLEPKGGDGVDLDLGDGSTVRLFREGTRIFGVGYFETNDSDSGYAIGDCATGSIENQSTFTNGVQNLAGDVTLACDVVRRITGEATFSNCH